MATTPIEFTAPSGRTLTADLVNLSDDSLSVTGGACTEQTNAKRQYRFDHEGEETGVHKVVIKSGSTVIGGQFVNVVADDTTVYRANDSYEVALSVRTIDGNTRNPDGFVYVDTSNGDNGNVGSISSPVATVANAITKGNHVRLKKGHGAISIGESIFPTHGVFDIAGAIILDGENLTPKDVVSSVPGGAILVGAGETLNFGGATNFQNIAFFKSAVYTGNFSLDYGYFDYCTFASEGGGSYTIAVTDTSFDAESRFYHCQFGMADAPPVIFDLSNAYAGNGSTLQGTRISLIGCYGRVHLAGLQSANGLTGQHFYFNGWGKLTILASCTGGTVYYNSHIAIDDQSGGAVTLVPLSSAATDASIADAVWDEATSGHVTAGTFGALVAGITTLLSRIGSWTGTGRNTILGAFQALFRSDADATVPGDVNADLGSGAGGADNTTDSMQAQAAAGGGLDAAGVRDALGMEAADMDDQLDALLTAVGDVDGGGGERIFSVSLTIRKTDLSLVPEADVTLTTSSTSASTNVHQRKTANNSGVVVFDVNEGTYYVWREKSGVTFNNPATLVVDSAGDATISGGA